MRFNELREEEEEEEELETKLRTNETDTHFGGSQ